MRSWLFREKSGRYAHLKLNYNKRMCYSAKTPATFSVLVLGNSLVLMCLLLPLGPGDTVAHVSRSSMVALHTLLSRVKCIGSCNVIISVLYSPPVSCRSSASLVFSYS